MEARTRGNGLFTDGEIKGALEAYSEGLRLTTKSSDETTLLLCNRAACALRLGDDIAAVIDCRAALKISPLCAKAHLRLATALEPEDQEAAYAVAAAIALLLPKKPGLQLPEDWRLVACVSSASNAARAVASGATLVVLRPGRYILPPEIERAPPYTLLGIGTVELFSPTHSNHALWVNNGAHVVLCNLRLVGNGQASAVAVGDGTKECFLRIISCSVVDYGDVGVLVVGALAELVKCTFRRCAMQAVEVRQGGSLVADRVTIEDCRQGVVAYGGARSVVITNSTILRCANEGVLAASGIENAAMQLQTAVRGPTASSRSTSAEFATENAMAWAKTRKQVLELTVADCTISQCGNIGMSVDTGARATISRCRFESNDPCSVLVKGASDACVAACQFVFAGRSNLSQFARAAGGGKLAVMGVNMGINYAGSVHVINCAFAGPESQGVVDDMASLSSAASTAAMRRDGMWSKPLVSLNNLFFVDSCMLPPVAELSAGLPIGVEGMGPDRAIGAAPAPTVALRRISGTFQQAAWAPCANEYYAIGNTQGYDVTGGLLGKDVTSARILLAGCGDIRNILATVASVDHGLGGAGHQLDFVLNDGNASQLARNAVMLYMAAELRAAPEAVLAVWANHALSGTHAALLRKSCIALADNPWPTWLRALPTLDESLSVELSEAPVRSACRAWASCSMTLAQLLTHRNAVVEGKKAARVIELSLAATAGRHEKEVRHYVRTGSLKALDGGEALSQPNPTLLIAPELQYTLYFSSSIFRAQAMAVNGANAQQRLMLAFSQPLELLACSLLDNRVSISLVPGDALVAACSSEEAPPFDFIDCSNVGDYVSLQSLLQACAPLLSPEPHARCRLESIVQYSKFKQGSTAVTRKTPADASAFLSECCLGVPPEVHAALLGLRFMGGQELGDLQSTLRCEWAPVAAGELSGLQTPASLLLTLSPLFHKWVAQHVTSTQGQSGLLCDWAARGSPLAFVHLATLTQPATATSLLAALLRCAAPPARLFTWELTMHAKVQQRRNGPLLRFVMEVQPGFRLVRHEQNPLLLAFSVKSLCTGFVSLAEVKQLVSSIVWDEDSATAQFLLPASTVKKCGNWWVTLCAFSSAGLDVVGASQLLSSLITHSIEAPLPWRPLRSHSLAQSADAHVPDCALLEQAAPGRVTGTWRSSVEHLGKYVAVDMLAPQAVSSEAKLRVNVASGVLRVMVDDKDAFEVQLPKGVVDGVPSGTKMNKELGLICTKVQWVTGEVLRAKPPQPASAINSPALQRVCGSCGVPEGKGVGLKPCGRCKSVVYCGKSCQAEHWKKGGHKDACVAFTASR